MIRLKLGNPIHDAFLPLLPAAARFLLHQLNHILIERRYTRGEGANPPNQTVGTRKYLGRRQRSVLCWVPLRSDLWVLVRQGVFDGDGVAVAIGTTTVMGRSAVIHARLPFVAMTAFPPDTNSRTLTKLRRKQIAIFLIVPLFCNFRIYFFLTS